jgi:hypothetical protein
MRPHFSQFHCSFAAPLKTSGMSVHNGMVEETVSAETSSFSSFLEGAKFF